MQPRSPYLSLLLALLLPAGSLSLAAAPARPKHPRKLPLPQAVARILSDPAVNQAHWGISVASLSGKPIYALNDGQYFNPASNAKLFTTAAAYALLPTGLTFTTLVASEAPVSSSGELGGNITIFGVGDPNISARTVPFGLKTERPGPPLAHTGGYGRPDRSSWCPFRRRRHRRRRHLVSLRALCRRLELGRPAVGLWGAGFRTQRER